MKLNVTVHEPEDEVYIMAEGGNVRVYEVQPDGSLIEIEPVKR